MLITYDKKIPRFYGVAYHSSNIAATVCYPIPLNLIINKLRKIYLYFKKGCYRKSKYRQIQLQQLSQRLREDVRQNLETENINIFPTGSESITGGTTWAATWGTGLNLSRVAKTKHKLNAKELNKINQNEDNDKS